VPIQDLDAAAHQLVVVGLVARRAAQRRDAGALGDVDPDLRNEDPFEIEAGDHPATLTKGRATDNTFGARLRARAASLLMIALVGCAPTAGVSKTADVARPSPAGAAAGGPLRVGTSGDYPPFSVRAADGSLSGFDVAVAEAYASDRGRSLELVPFAWPDLERRLVAGDFDVAMGGVTVRGDRLAVAPMTAAVARASAVLVVPPRGARRPQRPDLTVAVNRGGHLERLARARLPRATIVAVDDNRSLPAILASGRVDGVITDSLELQSFGAHGKAAARVALVLGEDRKAYWVAPGQEALADDLDAWLAQREVDGTLQRLRARLLGPGGDAPGLAGPAAAALRVVDLVARRLLLMPEVAAAKRAADLPIDAPAREEAVYASARAAASRVGLAPEPYVDLVRAEVEAAKIVQRAVLAGDASGAGRATDGAIGPPTPDQAKTRLDSQLRPAIDRIDRAIRAALVAAAPLRMSVERLARALRADAAVPGFDDAPAGLLARALARIPAAMPAQTADSS
jgi:cyclohexadienyl dehydratase